MGIKRDYYPIADAAKMIGCTEADLIHLGANWKLDIWAAFGDDFRAWKKNSDTDKDDYALVTLSSGRYQVNPFDLEMLEAGRKDWLTVVHSGGSTYRLIDYFPNRVPSEMFVMTSDIEQLVAEGTPPSKLIAQSFSLPKYDGPTFAKLRAAMEAYPIAYDGKTPKLDDDVRPWLKQKYKCTDREASVFGTIIAENFGLK